MNAFAKMMAQVVCCMGQDLDDKCLACRLAVMEYEATYEDKDSLDLELDTLGRDLMWNQELWMIANPQPELEVK